MSSDWSDWIKLELRWNHRWLGNKRKVQWVARDQGKIILNSQNRTKRRVRNAWERDNVKSFLVLTCFGPSYAENDARVSEFNILSHKLVIRVKGSC